jgi:hypothetical protein
VHVSTGTDSIAPLQRMRVQTVCGGGQVSLSFHGQQGGVLCSARREESRLLSDVGTAALITAHGQGTDVRADVLWENDVLEREFPWPFWNFAI